MRVSDILDDAIWNFILNKIIKYRQIENIGNCLY